MLRGSKKSNCLARERDFRLLIKSAKTRFFEDVSSESAIFDDFLKIRRSSSSFRRPPSKTTLKAIWPLRRNIITFTFLSESATFKSTSVRPKCATDEHAEGTGDTLNN